MHGDDREVVNFLNANSAYEIPPYQRDYQWTSQRWHGLVNDVLEATTRTRSDPAHWLGIVLLTKSTEDIPPGGGTVLQWTVIDGQQRLVTLLVWFAALADHAVDSGRARPIDVTTLSKVTVQKSDQIALDVALTGQWRDPKFAPLLQAETSPLVAYYYFRFLLWLGEDALLSEDPVPLARRTALKPGETFEARWSKLVLTKAGAKLPRGNAPTAKSLVDTTGRLAIHALLHDPRIDEPPAEIFDSLNGERTELQPIDHVRNSLFIRIRPRAAVDRLFQKWEPQEDLLRNVKVGRTPPGKLFLYDYVIAMGEKSRQQTLNANRGSAHFAVMTRGIRDAALGTYMTDVLLPAMATWPVVVRNSDVVQLNGVRTSFTPRALELMSSIYELTTNPANPVVLQRATAFVLGQISDTELEDALFVTETYLVRQLLATRPQSPFRSKFMEVMGKVDKDLSLSKLVTELKARDWVSNAEIANASARPYYQKLGPHQLGAIFRGIERSLGVGAMPFRIGQGLHEYTIEHIYPQKPNKWAADIAKWRGADASKMNDLAHSLGNLTVATNKHQRKVGNGTFAQKQKEPTSGKIAPLNLNKDWLSARRWTQREMAARTKRLIGEALSYWVTPP